MQERKQRERGESYKALARATEATRCPIWWRVGPTMVLVREINMMLQIALSTIKLHLSTKQLVLILSMLLLLVINGIEPQVEARKVITRVLIEMGSIEARGAYPSAAPGQKGSVLLLLKGNNTETARSIRTTLTTRSNTTRSRIAAATTCLTNFPTIRLGSPHHLTPSQHHHQKSNWSRRRLR